jgi:hypothetical protein
MKLYTVSTTRGGTPVNTNYTSIAANDFDTQLGVNFHLFYPVEIPEGTNSLFQAVDTSQVDSAATGWTTEATQTDKDNSIIGERIILAYNDSNQVIPTMRLFISDQQLTGCAAELTPWNTTLTHEIQNYSSFEILSTNPVNKFPENMYIKANFQGTLPEPTAENREIVITNMQPYSWTLAALRTYIVKDVEVVEDFCIIATETS